VPDLLESFRRLVDEPAAPPEPVEVLERRVAARARWRHAVAGGAVVTVIAVLAVALLPDRDGPATEVHTGPAAEPPAEPPAAPPAVEEHGRSSLTVSVPNGWQILFRGPERIVLGTVPLSEGDLALALLARDDSAFSSFPPAAVVVAVGADPLEAKYTVQADGSVRGPGPEYALGEEKVLAGGVRVRRGDIPQSILRIAAYAGPEAPAERLVQAERITAGLRLSRTGSEPVPPPPPGSRPGFPHGGAVPTRAYSPPAVAARFGTHALAAEADGDCGYLYLHDAAEPLTGSCTQAPAGAGLVVVGVPVVLPSPPPAGPTATGVLFRAGPGVARVEARLLDGRTVPAALGSGGWGVVAAEGRIVALQALDGAGRPLGEAVTTA
jgi:hypothetical protein